MSWRSLRKTSILTSAHSHMPVMHASLRAQDVKKFEEFHKAASMLKDQQLDGLSTCKKNGLGLLAELQTMKFEGLVIEAFRQLKIKENLKRVVRKNLADVASGKVVEGSVLSQILQQCTELLEG